MSRTMRDGKEKRVQSISALGTIQSTIGSMDNVYIDIRSPLVTVWL